MRRRSKVVMAAAAVAVLGSGAVFTAQQLTEPQNAEAGEAAERGMRTTPVSRGSLAAGTVLSGTLSRGEPEPLNGVSEGILTWIPSGGATIRSGERLFESNGRPTFLLRGEVPLWRPLQYGDRGKDVQSLNSALAAAGVLDESRADDVFGPGTSGALAKLFESAGYEPPSRTSEGKKRVEAAQEAYDTEVSALEDAKKALTAAQQGGSSSPEPTGESDGAGATGEAPDLASLAAAVKDAQKNVSEAARDFTVARAEFVSPADVVIVDSSQIRVASVPVRVGEPASGEVLRWTGATISAEAEVTRSQQASLSVGDSVTVTLPDGQELPGKIASTDGSHPDGGSGDGAVDGAGGGEGESAESATVVVEIEDQDELSGSVGAAVRIEVTTDSVEDALIVPVTALVALAEGGYAVEKVMPDSSPGSGTLVPVEVGLVAEAKVQVTSAQLDEGDKVLIP
ncbi:hypothetical protein [Myceligenerans xiligouense]|uniref:Peptidoglycan binding protein n=1 Tax=Myceligenerans xiligouense TaxID=253184 RepID=A0A3N4YTU2_9MICO|nr:hypothetical protein [Myceligenerans xiligouense]RPF22794.1 hypothetical protein EDD34_3466 [Myceligenerans xiligouense]